MTGSNNARVHQLPDTAGMKDEVIVQRMQINFYELMIRLTGARIVPAGLANRTYPWHLEAAFTDQTAAIVHFPAYSPPTDLPIGQAVELAHARGVPVIVDVAAEFPPFSNPEPLLEPGSRSHHIQRRQRPPGPPILRFDPGAKGPGGSLRHEQQPQPRRRPSHEGGQRGDRGSPDRRGTLVQPRVRAKDVRLLEASYRLP